MKKQKLLQLTNEKTPTNETLQPRNSIKTRHYNYIAKPNPRKVHKKIKRSNQEYARIIQNTRSPSYKIDKTDRESTWSELREVGEREGSDRWTILLTGRTRDKPRIGERDRESDGFENRILCFGEEGDEFAKQKLPSLSL